MSANRGLDLESVNKNKMFSLNLHFLLRKSAHREKAIERPKRRATIRRARKASSYHRGQVLSLLQSIRYWKCESIQVRLRPMVDYEFHTQ